MWRTKETLQKEEQKRSKKEEGRGWKKANDHIGKWKKGEDEIGRWKKEDESCWRTQEEEEEEEEAERSAANLDYVAGCGVLGVRRRSTFRFTIKNTLKQM